MLPMEIIGFPLGSLSAISTKCSLSTPFPLERIIESGSLEVNGSVILFIEILSSQFDI